MTVARSVNDVLSEHVVFEVECIDRMFCNVYAPGLQFARGLVGYVLLTVSVDDDHGVSVPQ